jgi:hypothetical protein
MLYYSENKFWHKVKLYYKVEVKFLPPNVFVAVLKLGDELDFVVAVANAGFPVELLLEAM